MKVIRLPFKLKNPILACGADVKGAYALAKGDKVCLADNFGDLKDLDNLSRYEKSIASQMRALNIRPDTIACDLHPGYFSTRFAEDYRLSTIDYRLFKVQHHEAHVAACMVDNGLKGEVIGVAFDGTGYGCDGNIWGGEFFVGSLRGFKRAAHLRYIPMPGGEAVVKEPRRMAAAYLYKTIGEDALTWMDRRTWKVLKTMIDRRINSPLTSSVGRLFDAAASLILAKDFAAKEAEGPMELERVSDASVRGSYDFEIAREGDMLVLDAARTMRGLMKEPFARVAAAKFHNTVAEMIASSCKLLRRRHHVKKVVLSGGVFQNRLLLKKARELLAKSDFKIYSSVNVPTNDSGIPIGQAAIANARCR